MNNQDPGLPVDPNAAPAGKQGAGQREALMAAPVRYHRMNWKQRFSDWRSRVQSIRISVACIIAGAQPGHNQEILDPSGRLIGSVNVEHPEYAVTLNLWARAWDIGVALVEARKMLVETLPEHQTRALVRRIDIAMDGITHPAIQSPASPKADTAGAQGGQ